MIQRGPAINTQVVQGDMVSRVRHQKQYGLRDVGRLAATALGLKATKQRAQKKACNNDHFRAPGIGLPRIRPALGARADPGLAPRSARTKCRNFARACPHLRIRAEAITRR